MVVDVKSGAELTQLVGTHQSIRCLAHLLNSGHQHADEHADHPEHSQEIDKGKGDSTHSRPLLSYYMYSCKVHYLRVL